MSALTDRVPGPMLAAFLRRDLQTALSYRLPFVLDALSSVFQLVLFYFLAQIVDTSASTTDIGFDDGYFAFAVVGLSMTRIIDTALRSFSSKLRTEQTTGTFEVLIATPSSLPALVLGSSGYNLLYGMLSGGLMLVVAGALGLRINATAASLAGAAVGFAASMAFFASAGVLVAAFIVVYKQGAALLGLATQVLGLLGGVYFPVTVLPGPLRVLAGANPLTWSLDVLRAGLLDAVVRWRELGLLCAAATLLLPASLWMLRIAVDRARRDGSLAKY